MDQYTTKAVKMFKCLSWNSYLWFEIYGNWHNTEIKLINALKHIHIKSTDVKGIKCYVRSNVKKMEEKKKETHTNGGWGVVYSNGQKFWHSVLHTKKKLR